MSSGTHDNGRLFGWDGVSMWTEPTLGDSVAEPPVHFICKRCGAATAPGIGYVSDTPGPWYPAPTCPENHLSD
jgi:hypothetical protein